jgi:hypothetical protein
MLLMLLLLLLVHRDQSTAINNFNPFLLLRRW